MGCKCANNELENNSEIKKYEEEDKEQFQVSNNRDSNLKEGIFSFDQNPELNQDISPSVQKYEEIPENIPSKIYEKNMKYSDYPEKMLELINKIREDRIKKRNMRSPTW